MNLIAKMTGTKRQIAQDRVPQSRNFTKTWNVPQWVRENWLILILLAMYLLKVKHQDYINDLYMDDQIATDVSALLLWWVKSAVNFKLQQRRNLGTILQKWKRAIDEELAKFLKEGSNRKRIRQRIKTQAMARFYKGNGAE